MSSTPDSRRLRAASPRRSPSGSCHLAIAHAMRHRFAVHRVAEHWAMRAVSTPGSATFHRYLTPRRWNARYAPPGARVSAVPPCRLHRRLH